MKVKARIEEARWARKVSNEDEGGDFDEGLAR